MIEIIPAIDLMGGKCVRLAQGDFERRTEYSDDPVGVARDFESGGVRRLHVVDLDGARSGRPVNIGVLESIAKATNMTIDFGGGIKSDEDIERVFDGGAAIANIGSVAVTEPKRFFGWLKRFGSERILLGADTIKGRIAINGWQTTTEVGLIEFLNQYFARGGTQAFVTDVDKDGMLAGPSITVYEEVLAAVPELKLIASGGVASLDDIERLAKIGCSGAIVGKAIYEGQITIDEIEQYLCSRNE